MLKYTVAAFSRIKRDLEILSKFAAILMQSFMTVYLTLAIVFDNGSRVINSILLGLTVVHFTLYLIFDGKKTKLAKKVKGYNSKIYTYSKLALNAVSLASVIYSIYVSPDVISSITMVTTPLMIVLWVLQVLFEVVKVYVSVRADLVLDGLAMDFEFATKPIVKARNVLHDFIGEEREPETSVSAENRRILTEQAEINEEEKKKKKAERPKNILLRAFDEAKRRLMEKIKKKDAPTVESEAENEPLEMK